MRREIQDSIALDVIVKRIKDSQEKINGEREDKHISKKPDIVTGPNNDLAKYLLTFVLFSSSASESDSHTLDDVLNIYQVRN